METQNAEMTVFFPEIGSKQSPASRSNPAEKLNNRKVGSLTVQRPLGRYEAPTVTRAELKRRNHSDMPVKTRLATRKSMTLNPGGANEYGAVNSPPLVDPSVLFLTSPYPITVATHGSLGWALATLVIIVFLAATLMVGIAISV